VMAVALAQPHRRGNCDPKLGSSLGRFCVEHKLGEHLYEAGLQYRNVTREHLNAWGFAVDGWEPSDRGYAEMTDEQRRACRDLADKRLRSADKILNALYPRRPGWLPGLITWLCCGGGHCTETDVVRRGLMALSDAWGMTPRHSWEKGQEENPSDDIAHALVWRAQIAEERRMALWKGQSPVSRWIQANGPVPNVVGAWDKTR
jgi:hypothetical protein